MKRDMDLIRELLLRIEVAGGKPSWKQLLDGQDADATITAVEHLELMLGGGLIAGTPFRPLKGHFELYAIELTWQGHDFLDTIRDPKIWEATKAGAKQAGGFSLDLMKALAKGLIKKNIERYTGVDLDL